MDSRLCTCQSLYCRAYLLCHTQVHPLEFINIQKGLDTLGIHVVDRQYSQFLDLLRPSGNAKLSVKMLLHLLKTRFSAEGSNNLKYWKNVYTYFIKYVREVARGGRVTTLKNILEFATVGSEEPLLGFTISPSFEFVEGTCGTWYRQHASDIGGREVWFIDYFFTFSITVRWYETIIYFL